MLSTGGKKKKKSFTYIFHSHILAIFLGFMTLVLLFKEYSIKIRILVQKKDEKKPKKVYLCRQSRKRKKKKKDPNKLR